MTIVTFVTSSLLQRVIFSKTRFCWQVGARPPGIPNIKEHRMHLPFTDNYQQWFQFRILLIDSSRLLSKIRIHSSPNFITYYHRALRSSRLISITWHFYVCTSILVMYRTLGILYRYRGFYNP